MLAFVLSIVFMYLIQAAQFESWVHPASILLSLPMTVAFALLSLVLQNEIYTAFGVRMNPRRRGKSDVENAVVSAARRERIDVAAALEAAQRIERDEDLANELVRIAIDVDAETISPLLRAVIRIKDEMSRARTLFSLFQRTNIARELPESAQDDVVVILQGIGDEAARAAALRNLPSDVPDPLRARLSKLGEALGAPLRRLQVALHYEKEPSEERARALLEAAKSIEDEEDRGRALAAVTPVLSSTQLEDAFGAAKALAKPDLAALALVKIAARFADDRRRQAQVEILRIAESVDDPVRKFDAMSALHDLPGDTRRSTQTRLFDLAGRFEDPTRRCRAMFITAAYAQDDAALQQDTILAGIAAAECVPDERLRSELFMLLRRGAPSLPVPVRRELTRAVGRIEHEDIREELTRNLGRFFVYEKASVSPRPARPPEDQWDVFISYATADLSEARFLAAELKSRAMRVFLSADAIEARVGSGNWILAIDEALTRSRAMLVLQTEHAAASKWVREEWTKYYGHTVDTGSGVLFTLRLSGPPIADFPLTLRNKQCIDSATGRIEPDHLRRIMDIVRGL